MAGPTSLKLSCIRVDGGTQPRAQLDWLLVDEYADVMLDDRYLPPVEVTYDGADYWLWDGFHRLEATRKIGKDSIAANVQQGTRRDAVLLSVSANAHHGLRRTNEDKRRAVETLLKDEEWSQWSDREIARRAAVSHTFVTKLRPEIVSVNDLQMERKVQRNGTIYTQDTTNIGGNGHYEPEPEQPELNYDEVAEEFAGEVDGYDWTDEEPEPEAELETEDAPVPPPAPKSQSQPQGSMRNTVSLVEWKAMTVSAQVDVIDGADRKTKYGWNETNDNVEWASWTWNPLTGCLHECPYCYARDIANHYFSHLDHLGDRFSPVFYPDRLFSPTNAKAPDTSMVTDPIRRMALRNVFTCSMADLFGKWVPTEWIEAVLQQAHDNPQWTFLFLTKFPIRMAEFEFPPNSWIGTTVDKQWAVDRAEKAFRKIRAGGYKGVAWLSCEPMLERLTFSSLDMFDWVVMGGSSKSTQTPAFAPPVEWWIHLWSQAKTLGIPVYMKTNLIQQSGNAVDFDGRVREWPTQAIGE